MKKSDVPSPQRILERAIEVLEEHGEAGIRTHQIAEDCGVTAPILYKAFGSREGLITAAQIERYRRSRDYLGEALRAGVEAATTVAELRRILHDGLVLMMGPHRAAHRRWRMTVYGSAMTRPELEAMVVEALRTVTTGFAEVLERAWERGLVAYTGDLTTFVTWWGGMMDGRINLEMNGMTCNVAEYDALTIRATLDSLLGPEGTAS